MAAALRSFAPMLFGRPAFGQPVRLAATVFTSPSDFHVHANQCLETLYEKYDALCEDRPATDVSMSDGVLTINLGGAGVYVVNKQSPNQQIWLSSPISGPRRFEFDGAKSAWVCNREGVELLSLLQREIV
eukprot:m.106840 g.106840  ORF g.106840 m.106840 type:complete len:130 (-) comp8955_c2_seq7:119-508(-)